MYWFYQLALHIVMWILLLWFDLRFEGVENIPDKKSHHNYVVICNHRSILDPIFIAWRIPKMVCYMGKAELFKNKLAKFFFEAVGVFPVERGSGDMSALNYGIDLYRKGYSIGIFPEGTRSKNGTPLRPKSGAALVAKLAEANVLPCAVIFEGKLHFRKRIVIKYGPIVPYEVLGLGEDSPRALKKATKVMWDGVLALLGLEEKADADHNG